MAGSCQGIEGEVACEVDKGAGDGGDRDAAVRVWFGLVSCAFGDDAGQAAVGLRGDFGRGRRAFDEAVEVGGGAGSEESVVAASEDGGEVAGLGARGPVADAVDARVLAEQDAEAHTVRDLVDAEARAEQLPASDDAMLTRRDS